MANAKIIEQKAKKVEEIREKLNRAQSVIIFDYRGLTVAEVTELRNDMRKAGVEYVVLKNGLVSRATKLNAVDDKVQDFLVGPNAFAFGYDDAVTPAKILKEAIRKYKKCSMIGGIVDGKVMTAAEVEVLADLPSKEQLIARLLGSMMSPIAGLAIVLDQIAKQRAQQPAEA